MKRFIILTTSVLFALLSAVSAFFCGVVLTIAFRQSFGSLKLQADGSYIFPFIFSKEGLLAALPDIAGFLFLAALIALTVICLVRRSSHCGILYLAACGCLLLTVCWENTMLAEFMAYRYYVPSWLGFIRNLPHWRFYKILPFAAANLFLWLGMILPSRKRKKNSSVL